MDNPTNDNAGHSERELIYLDNAATSYPKPASVVKAVRDCLDKSLTVARSTHLAEFRGDQVLRECRVKLAKFFGADNPEEMVYTYSATDGLNIALNGFIKPGSHVVVSPLEHHSVMRPLHHMRKELGVSFTELPAGADGLIDPNRLEDYIRPQTSAVVINWVSNVTGTMQPVEEIGKVVRDLGLPFIVDAAQATGTHPVNVKDIGCHAMAQPAHKALMSLPGMGVLYLSSEIPVKPWRVGGTGYRSDLVMQPEEAPVRYESGTVNVPGVVGLSAAMDWFDEVGIENIQKRLNELIAKIIDGLREIPRVSVVGPPAGLDRGFVVSFTIDDSSGSPIDPLVISQIIAERYRISSRAGLHCAPTAHKHFGTYDRGGTVRFSVSYFTTDDDVDAAVNAVKEIASEF